MPEKKLSKADREFIQKYWKIGSFFSNRIFTSNKDSMLKKLTLMGVLKKTSLSTEYEIDRERFMEVDKQEKQGSLF